MEEKKEGGLSLPPPAERRILMPGQAGIPIAGTMPGPTMGPPGMPQAGPGGQPIQRIAHSGQPMTVAITFAPPPGWEAVPPNGVFWAHGDGVLMAQTIGNPAILDGVRRVEENGKVVDGDDVDSGPDAGRGDGSGGDGIGANEEGSGQTTTPSEPEPV